MFAKSTSTIKAFNMKLVQSKHFIAKPRHCSDKGKCDLSESTKGTVENWGIKALLNKFVELPALLWMSWLDINRILPAGIVIIDWSSNTTVPLDSLTSSSAVQQAIEGCDLILISW